MRDPLILGTYESLLVPRLRKVGLLGKLSILLMEILVIFLLFD